MPTPFTELELANLSAGEFAYLAYDLENGFRLFKEVTDGNALYYRDISEATPADSTRTLAGSATVLGGKLVTISNTTVTAGSLVTGRYYKILTVGSTDFTAVGASANTVGVWFKATGAGTGTGTANADFSLLSNQEGQIVKVNNIWCTINEYINNTTITVDRVVTAGNIQFPVYYPDAVNETIIGKITLISIAATAIVAGKTYQILTAGDTDFTDIGAADNVVGTQFTATDIGTGTGTVSFFTIEPYYSNLNNIPTGSTTTSGSYLGEPRLDGAGLLFIWNGLVWVPANTTASEVVVSATAPSSPSDGMLWFRTTDSRMFLWSGTIWVQSIPGVSGSRTVDITVEAGLYDNETVVDSTDGNLYRWNATTGLWVLIVETIVVDLTNQVHACPSDTTGTTVDYTGAFTEIHVYSGGVDVTPLVCF